MKKVNNEGFSLVELIIVIAIMAILVGVLAPQYLKYVERSRKSADISAIDTIMNAMELAAADPSMNLANGDKMTVTFASTGYVAAFAATDSLGATTDTKYAAIKKDLEDTCGSYTLRSNDFRTATLLITATIDATNHVVFTIDADHGDGKGAASVTDYSPTLGSRIN